MTMAGMIPTPGELLQRLGVDPAGSPLWNPRTTRWLSRGFLRAYSSEKPARWDLLDDDDVCQHPVDRETFPAGLREGVRLVHASRERLYRISEALPAGHVVLVGEVRLDGRLHLAQVFQQHPEA